MRQGSINQIADTAIQLKNRLTALGVFPRTADEWVTAAMPAIVTFEVARPPSDLHPDAGLPHEPRSRAEFAEESSGKPPLGSPEEKPYLHRRLGRPQPAEIPRSRLGNLAGVSSLAGIEPAVIERLVSGPGQDDTDMRLVAVTGLAAGAAAETAAFCWVRDNVPGAGPILNATYAGRITAGAASPVYLITFQLAGSRDPGTRVHPAGGADEVPS